MKTVAKSVLASAYRVSEWFRRISPCFPFTKYGTLAGEVRTLSQDATPDENLGLVYATRVRMHQATMQVQEKIVNLTPGMAVTVEVNMGKRRLIEFLLSPLLRYRDESVRER